MYICAFMTSMCVHLRKQIHLIENQFTRLNFITQKCIHSGEIYFSYFTFLFNAVKLMSISVFDSFFFFTFHENS